MSLLRGLASLLVLLYPAAFRRRLGPEITETFDDWLSTARTRQELIGRGLRGLVQLARAGLRERLQPSPLAGRTSGSVPPRTQEAPAVDSLFQDLRYAFRALVRRPGFAGVAIVTLAFGIGASTAMFSVVDGVLLRPMAHHAPEDLLALFRTSHADRVFPQPMSMPDLRDLQDQAGSLEHILGYGTGSVTLTGRGEARIVAAGRVTDGPLSVFGEQPERGRDLRRGDSADVDGERVVVVGWGFWQQELGGAPDVVGSNLDISGDSYTIVGVAPRGFSFPERVQLWLPYRVDLEDCGRDCHFLSVIARRVAGTPVATVRAELDLIAERLEAAYPEENTHKRFAVRGYREELTREVRPALYLLLGAVSLVLLIAAANVANLLLVRGARRRRELAVRSAVGASRWRLCRQLGLESALLSGVAGLLGVALGSAALTIFLRLAPPDLPRLAEVGLDWRAVAFAFVVTAVLSLLSGWLPAWRQARVDLRTRMIRDGGGRTTRSVLLAAEVALSLLLLLGTGLLMRSFAGLVAVELGFEPRQVTTFAINLPSNRYTPEQSVAFFAELESRLAAAPGVESVGSAFARPLGDTVIGGGLVFADRPEPPAGERDSSHMNAVTTGYFETLGIPLLEGRAFGLGDRHGTAPVAMVNRAFTETFYGGRSPIGEQVEIGVSLGYEFEGPLTIVGVVADTRAYGIADETLPELYMAQAQAGSTYLHLAVRSRPGVEPLTTARRELRRLDPDLALRELETLEESVSRNLGPSRFYLLLLAAFAGLALLLAAIGLYAVVAYLVAQRRREIAVRMALGADRGRVLRLVVGEGLVPAALGIGVGLVLALAGARILESLLYGVTPRDPSTFVAATLTLLAVTLLASAAPARRATSIAPAVVLKED